MHILMIILLRIGFMKTWVMIEEKWWGMVNGGKMMNGIGVNGDRVVVVK